MTTTKEAAIFGLTVRNFLILLLIILITDGLFAGLILMAFGIKTGSLVAIIFLLLGTLVVFLWILAKYMANEDYAIMS